VRRLCTLSSACGTALASGTARSAPLSRSWPQRVALPSCGSVGRGGAVEAVRFDCEIIHALNRRCGLARSGCLYGEYRRVPTAFSARSATRLRAPRQNRPAVSDEYTWSPTQARRKGDHHLNRTPSGEPNAATSSSRRGTLKQIGGCAMTDKRHHHLSGYHSSAFRHPIPGYMGLSDPRGPFENSAAASKKAALFGKRYSHDEELKVLPASPYQKICRTPSQQPPPLLFARGDRPADHGSIRRNCGFLRGICCKICTRLRQSCDLSIGYLSSVSCRASRLRTLPARHADVSTDHCPFRRLVMFVPGDAQRYAAHQYRTTSVRYRYGCPHCTCLVMCGCAWFSPCSLTYGCAVLCRGMPRVGQHVFGLWR